jgi:LmbE family N-acetylglucosaminyl deacetylase
MVVAVLSPHLDDAVLSCWHLLTQPQEVMVVNVFAGVPSSGGALAWWDELTGATDSEQRVHERVEEDREALALAGRIPVNLSFLDDQYRASEQPIAPVAARISELLSPGARVYAPAGLGGHADHELVRSAALELRGRGFEVSLYAELPHATLNGWPAWVTSSGAATSTDLAAALWERTLASTGIERESIVPEVHELDSASHARKLEAVHAYGTQLQALTELAGTPLADRKTLGYEVLWNLPFATTSAPAHASRGAGPRL